MKSAKWESQLGDRTLGANLRFRKWAPNRSLSNWFFNLGFPTAGLNVALTIRLLKLTIRKGFLGLGFENLIVAGVLLVGLMVFLGVGGFGVVDLSVDKAGRMLIGSIFLKPTFVERVEDVAVSVGPQPHVAIVVLFFAVGIFCPDAIGFQVDVAPL